MSGPWTRTVSAKALFLGDRLVELGDAARRFADVEELKRADVAAGFGAGDQQQRVENLDQPVRFLDRLLEREAIGRGVAVGGERRLGVISQAGERRAQVMRDVVGNLAQAFHQLGDSAQHLVEAFRQPVQFVAGARHRQAAREVAGHDAARGGVDVVDPLQHPPGHEQRPDRPERGEEDQRNRERAHHHRPDAGPVAEVMPDQEAEAARQHVDSHERLPAAAAALVAAVEDRQKTPVQQHFGGDLLDIACERLADRVRQQVERGAGLAPARLDDGAEACVSPRC